MALTLTAESLADGPWAGITLTGLAAGNQSVTIWRTADGLRKPVPGAIAEPVVDSAYFIDYAAPVGRPVIYEAEILSGADAAATVPNATVTLDYDTGFIHDPRNPSVVVAISASMTTNGTPVFAGGAFTKLSRQADVEIHNIVGAEEPVAIAGQRRSPAGVDLSLLSDAESENTRLRDMLKASVLVIRIPPGWIGGWPAVAFVALPEVVELPLEEGPQNVGGYLTKWEMIGSTVRASLSRPIVALFTYDDVKAVFSTYAQKQTAAGGGTYLDDQKNPFNA